MNINDLFPSRFVKAHDLKGKSVTLTILRVQMEDVRGERGEESKPVVYFEKAKKGLLLNRTNAMTIAALYGPDTDTWSGKRITIYSTQVQAFGKLQDAVRVVEAKPYTPANLPAAHDDVPDELNQDVPADDEYPEAA